MSVHVLSISSQVAYGPVGNSVSVPAMEALGVTVHAVPTVILSSHPGFGPPAGFKVEARNISAILGALEGLGVLARCHAVLTGYFGANDQIFGVARIIRRMKEANPSLYYLCDPVLGDDPHGLYVPQAVAEAIRQELVPLSSCVSPNRYELEWLSGHPVSAAKTAVKAARSLPCAEVLATSIPVSAAELDTLLIGNDAVYEQRTKRRTIAMHGTGDALAGLFLGYRALGRPAQEAFSSAMVKLETIIAANESSDVLEVRKGLP